MNYDHFHDFLYWEYDHHNVTVLILDTETETISRVLRFRNEDEALSHYHSLKKTFKDKDGHIEKHRLKIPHGLDILTDRIIPNPDDEERERTALFSMLDSCGRDLSSQQTMMMLFSCLLAGFSARNLIEMIHSDHKLPPLSFRAPLLAVHPSDGVFDALRYIVESICFPFQQEDIKKKNYQIRFSADSIYPLRNHDQSLLDCSFMKLSIPKTDIEKRFPLQQRDTGVLINTKFFPPSEVFQYQQRNPWVSTILYAPQDRHLLVDPIRLDAKVLARCQFDWAPEVLVPLFGAFSIFLASTFHKAEEHFEWYNKHILNAKSFIAKYNAKRGNPKIRGTKEVWYIIQLVTLEDFFFFLLTYRRWDCGLITFLRAKWLNLLLPGCMPLPKDTRPLKEREIITPERDGRELFEQTLLSMFEEPLPLRFPVVYPNETFPRHKDSTVCLGYIRMYRQNNDNANTFLSLQLNKKTFLREAKHFAPVPCNCQDILKSLRKKPPSYLIPTEKARMPETKLNARPTSALILNMEKMDFLPPHVKAYIQSNLLNQKPELTLK